MAKRTNPAAFRGTISVVGRILLCSLFVTAVIGSTTPNAARLASLVASKGLLGSTTAVVGCVAIVVLGCVSVVLGYRARIGALFLLAFLAVTTYFFHGLTLWTLLSPAARQEQIFYISSNLSLIGAMLFIVANGAGEMSLDGRKP
jgi:putative oxidoreductase